jgi:hypothetical protein
VGIENGVIDVEILAASEKAKPDKSRDLSGRLV